jgi:hypothetical protein
MFPLDEEGGAVVSGHVIPHVYPFVSFIKERDLIWKRRRNGRPKPWTDDPILQNFRFCNVLRERDTVTQWIAKNWRDPHNAHPDLWFAMAFARLFNRVETLEAVGFPLPWRPKQIKDHLLGQQVAGFTIFSGAYIVSTNGVRKGKIEYLIDDVLQPLWARRKMIRPESHMSLHQFACRLQTANGFKGFMAGQVVADVKYAPGSPLYNAADWDIWAVSGPGSRRGMNRVMGRDVDARVSEEQWLNELGELRTEILKPHHGVVFSLHAQDVQNCLCEFDKYERTRLGQGRPRCTYPGVK